MKLISDKLISIIIPVYNGSNYICYAINSLLKQSYKNIEIIIVNDGSDDEQALLTALEQYKEIDFIHYISKENGGVSSAVNTGINAAKGDYIIWLSHDDMLKPRSIETKIKKLQSIKYKNVILGTRTSFIDGKGKKLLKFSFYHRNYSKISDFFKYSNINGCSLLIPIEVAKAIPFNERLRYCQDLYQWCEYINLGYRFIVLKNKQTVMRIHPNQVTYLRSDLYEKEFRELFDNFVVPIINQKKEIIQIYYALIWRRNRYLFYENYIKYIEKNIIMTPGIKLKSKILTLFGGLIK